MTSAAKANRRADIVDRLEAEIERLRAFIWTLDGKTICIRSDGNTFIDDGIIVATDILNPVNIHKGTEP